MVNLLRATATIFAEDLCLAGLLSLCDLTVTSFPGTTFFSSHGVNPQSSVDIYLEDIHPPSRPLFLVSTPQGLSKALISRLPQLHIFSFENGSGRFAPDILQSLCLVCPDYRPQGCCWLSCKRDEDLEKGKPGTSLALLSCLPLCVASADGGT